MVPLISLVVCVPLVNPIELGSGGNALSAAEMSFPKLCLEILIVKIFFREANYMLISGGSRNYKNYIVNTLV